MWISLQKGTSEVLQAMVQVENYLYHQQNHLAQKTKDWGVEPGSNLDSKTSPNSRKAGQDIFHINQSP